jgi:hypothetical protein
MRYKVSFYKDGLYEVLETGCEGDEYWFSVFQGTLSDCEAWIRLKEGGYI